MQAFPGDTPALVFDGILNRAPISAVDLNVEVPSGLETIIAKLLEKDRNRRYRSAKELRLDLEHLRGVSDAGQPAPRAGLGWAARSRPEQPRGSVSMSWWERLLGAVRPKRIRSLAVLPLENLSRDPEQDYFADGMTEALISTLAQIGSLKVISRTSVLRYKGTDKPLPQIARELNVDAVVEGSVLYAGDQLRITAQLIHAATDRHLWAKSYERDITNVLRLQSEVAQAIAKEIMIKLTPRERACLTCARTVKPEAYEAYLKGRYYWNKWTTEGYQKGTEYFELAIAKDPGYAPPYAGLADTYSTLGIYGILPPKEAFTRAKTAARKALEIDDALGEAHTSLALIRFFFDWDWFGAEEEFQRAIKLNPSHAMAHTAYAFCLIAMGRLEEARREVRRAQELDPLSLLVAVALADYYYCVGDYDKATGQARKMLEMDPNFWPGHSALGWAYEHKAMHEEALAELQKAADLSGGNIRTMAGLGYAQAISGRKGEAMKVLDKLKELAKLGQVTSSYISMVYIGLGENNLAFEWLGRAYEERAPWLIWLKVDGVFDPLRSDPRFQDLLHRMNFPD